MSKTLQHHRKVDEIEGDGGIFGGGYFVHLKKGFQVFGGAHCFGADTVREAREILRMAGPCDCDSCRPADAACDADDIDMAEAELARDLED